MANELTKVSTSLLPMDDIAEILDIAYDFVTKAGKATDVENVAEVDARIIAVATSQEDRTTVRNAENLGNKPASYYMSKEEGGKIVNDSDHIKTIYSDEIRDVRDELYQLRMELAKSGVVANYKPYAGYHDLFKANDAVHEDKILASAAVDSATKWEIIIHDDLFGQFDKDDWIVLNDKETGVYKVVQITSKATDGQTLNFSPAVDWDIKADMTDIYKSLGEVKDGAFCFLKSAVSLPDSKEMYSCLDDDTFRLRRQIKSKNTGFGYTFRIPDAQKGFLVKLDIQAKTYGAPGSLMCYIIDETNISKWKNPVQAVAEGILLAKSQPLIHDAAYGEKVVSFNFWNGTNFPLLKEPDPMDHKVRYCAIIEALDADTSNFYDILFLQSRKPDMTMGDLQLNNITHYYTQKADSSLEPALVTDAAINATDLYYGITTRGEVNDGFIPHRVAVYSAHFQTPAPVEVSRARLMLRIAREGCYDINVPKPDVYKDSSTLKVKKSVGLSFNYDMDQLGEFGLKKDVENVIIGTTICRLQDVGADNIVLSKGMYVEPDQPVYRAGYNITLKAKRIEWDAVTCQFATLDQERITMPLSAVMPDKYKKDLRISDRLIYECDYLGDDLDARYFNDFEVQIHWHTEYATVYNDTKYKADLVGRIHDLVMSLDRTI